MAEVIIDGAGGKIQGVALEVREAAVLPFAEAALPARLVLLAQTASLRRYLPIEAWMDRN